MLIFGMLLGLFLEHKMCLITWNIVLTLRQVRITPLFLDVFTKSFLWQTGILYHHHIYYNRDGRDVVLSSSPFLPVWTNDLMFRIEDLLGGCSDHDVCVLKSLSRTFFLKTNCNAIKSLKWQFNDLSKCFQVQIHQPKDDLLISAKSVQVETEPGVPQAHRQQLRSVA